MSVPILGEADNVGSEDASLIRHQHLSPVCVMCLLSLWTQTMAISNLFGGADGVLIERPDEVGVFFCGGFLYTPTPIPVSGGHV